MRALLIFSTLFALAGCASTKDVEVTMLRVRPLELVVEVEDAAPRFDSAPDRYLMTLRVLQPRTRRGSQLHLLVDGVTVDRAAFIARGSCWRIACDEEAFDHEVKIGFSFWSFMDLRPKEEPNQSLEPSRL